MNKYYIYPDGTITEEPYNWLSDDYYVIEAEDEDGAYKQAVQMGLI